MTNHQFGDPQNMAQYIWSCGNVGDLRIKEKFLTSRLTASSQDVESRTFYSILPSLSEHLSDSYIMTVFQILLDNFCLSMAWKDNSIVHMSQVIAKEGNPAATPLLYLSLW